MKVEMTGKRTEMIPVLKKYGMITIAAVFYALGIGLFLEPDHLAPGGVSGIAIIINSVSGWETGTLILLMNIPLLLAAVKRYGYRFMLGTLYSTILSSLFINGAGKLGRITADPLLAALAGGTLVATGLGITFRAGATTGGMDIVIRFLKEKMPHRKTGGLLLMVDALVVTASAVVTGDVERALYAAVSLGVTSTVLNIILYGGDEARLIYIVSDYTREMAEEMMEALEVGITFLDGQGAYTGKDKDVIFCVVGKNQAPGVERIVKEKDPAAFMIITSATEIYGEGYKSLFAEKNW